MFLLGVELIILLDKELMKLERQIVDCYIGKMFWFVIVWGFLNLVVWLFLWLFVLLGIVFLWLGFIIVIINVVICYFFFYEVQYDIIVKLGEFFCWLNELLGYLFIIFFVFLYCYLKVIYMEYYKNVNNLDFDLDYGMYVLNVLVVIW